MTGSGHGGESGTGATPLREGGLSRPEMGEIARKLYLRTRVDSWGDRSLYEKVLELPIEWTRSFYTPNGWRVVWEKRRDKDATRGYLLIRKWPLQQGNSWEEVAVYTDGYLLDEDAYR